MIYHFNKIRAFTLIEILISVSILIFILLGVSGIFRIISVNQREISSDSLVLDNVNYFLFLASENLRYAQKGDGVLCGISNGRFFNYGAGYIDFIKDDECYSFELFDDSGVNRILMSIDSKGNNYISSKNVNILSLTFDCEDNINIGQTIATIFIKAQSVKDQGSQILAQTSVSVEYYE